MHKLLSLVVSVTCICSISAYTDNTQNAIQILKKLGMSSASMRPEVRKTKGKRKNDSPIYYIKLPPTAHFYHKGLPPMVSLMPPPPPPPIDPLHLLPIDFTNNGRPELVRNWHYPPPLINKPTNPTYSPLQAYNFPTGYVSDPYLDNEVDGGENPLLLPPELPLISNRLKNKVPTYPLDPSRHPIGNSLISLKDHYIYNGRPSSIYVWKPHKLASISKPKFKHPYFKHFNY